MLKYEDKILDGRWKFKKWDESGRAVFENIYNHNEVALSKYQIQDVLNGKTTVAQIMCRRIKEVSKFEKNKTISGWTSLRHRWASKQKNSDC